MPFQQQGKNVAQNRKWNPIHQERRLEVYMNCNYILVDYHVDKNWWIIRMLCTKHYMRIYPYYKFTSENWQTYQDFIMVIWEWLCQVLYTAHYSIINFFPPCETYSVANDCHLKWRGKERMLMNKTNTETQVQGRLDRIMSNSHSQIND